MPPDETLTSREAGEKHDNTIEAWGEAGWLQVGRLCRFYRDVGMLGAPKCPEAPETLEPPEPEKGS